MDRSSQQSFEDAVMDLDSSSESEANSDDLSDSDRTDDLCGGDDEEEEDVLDDRFDASFVPLLDKPSLIDFERPPVTSIHDMAKEMLAQWIILLLELAEKLGRPIRVLTMFSGTDSPLLFLLIVEALVNKALVEKGSPHRLKIHHVAACEADPRKAEFIEKNSKPDLLFKDALELGSGAAEATLWSGKKAPIPGDIDLVIAGPSCKDYSLLNANREPSKVEGKGKKADVGKKRPVSGQSQLTWDALVGYVRNHRPKIVIVENVPSAPWPRMCEEVRAIGYSVEKMLLNSTDFFLPCNRPRAYMVAFLDPPGPVDASHAVRGVSQVVKGLKRPPSVPAQAFLDPTGGDEPVHVPTGSRSASASQAKQAEFRKEHGLGDKRPLRDDESWRSRIEPDVLASMSERAIGGIENLIGILAKKGLDLFELDVYIVVSNSTPYRTIDPKFGVCPCLTTRGRIFSTRLRRCLTAADHLKLQGFPVEQLDFEGISYAVVKDMAGNAMALPVVGAVMMAALVVAWRDTTPLAPRVGAAAIDPRRQDQHADVKLEPIQRSAPSVEHPCSLPLGQLIDQVRSALDGANPDAAARLLRDAVPGALQLKGVDVAVRRVSDEIFKRAAVDELEKIMWLSRLEDAIAQPFRLVPVEVGSPVLRFESSSGVLSVEVLDAVPQAILHSNFQPGDLAGSSSPLATLVLPTDSSLVDGLLAAEWSLQLPTSATIAVRVTGRGDRVPSWGNDLGVVALQSEYVHDQLFVSWLGPSWAFWERLMGLYVRRDVSGCTPGSTWVHATANPPIYLALRTDLLCRSNWTGLVFTHRPGPAPHGTPLRDIARCDPGWRPRWRPSSDPPEKKLTVLLDHVPLPAPDVRLSIPSLPVPEMITTLPRSTKPVITAVRIKNFDQSHAKQAFQVASVARNDSTALGSLSHLFKDTLVSRQEPMQRKYMPRTLRYASSAGRSPFHPHLKDDMLTITLDMHCLPRAAFFKLPDRPMIWSDIWCTLKQQEPSTARPPAFAPRELTIASEAEIRAWVDVRRKRRSFEEKQVEEVTLSLDRLQLQTQGVASQVVCRRGGILVGGIGDVKAMLPVLNLLLPPPAPPNSQRLTLFIVSNPAEWETHVIRSGRRVLRIKDEADLVDLTKERFSTIDVVLIRDCLLTKGLATPAYWAAQTRSDPLARALWLIQAHRWCSLIYVSPSTKLSPLWVEWVRSLTVDVRWIWRPTSAVDDMDAIKQTASLLDIYMQEPYHPSPTDYQPRNSGIITTPSTSLIGEQQKRADAFVKLFVCKVGESDPPKPRAAPKDKDVVAKKRAAPSDESTSAEASRPSKRPRTASQQAELEKEKEIEIEVGQAGPGPSTMANRAARIAREMAPEPDDRPRAQEKLPAADAEVPPISPERVRPSQAPMIEEADDWDGIEMLGVTSSGQFVASQGASRGKGEVGEWEVDVDDYEWPDLTASGRFVSSSQASWIPSSLGSLTSSGQFKSA